MLPHLTQILLIFLSICLCLASWYITLMPHWLTQSGSNGNNASYAQGIGIWLNYTQHIGDVTFDPGNSLWVPIQRTGVETFQMQCSSRYIESSDHFCDNVIGEYYRQYCQVLDVYCGWGITSLQYLMPLLSGTSLWIIIWTIILVTTTHRTIVETYFAYICVAQGGGYFLAAVIWWFSIFSKILATAFYSDEATRCSEDNDGTRSCWGIGTCVIILLGLVLAYPLLSLLASHYIVEKIRKFHKSLRELHESASISNPITETHQLNVKKYHINTDNDTDKERQNSSAASDIKYKVPSQI